MTASQAGRDTAIYGRYGYVSLGRVFKQFNLGKGI